MGTRWIENELDTMGRETRLGVGFLLLLAPQRGCESMILAVTCAAGSARTKWWKGEIRVLSLKGPWTNSGATCAQCLVRGDGKLLIA